MATEQLTVERPFCPLDLLLFQRYRREVPGLFEDTLARNPGLAALGVFLPLGTVVTVEIPQAPARTAAGAAGRELITLF